MLANSEQEAGITTYKSESNHTQIIYNADLTHSLLLKEIFKLFSWTCHSTTTNASLKKKKKKKERKEESQRFQESKYISTLNTYSMKSSFE
jgi:hypothetical protein